MADEAGAIYVKIKADLEDLKKGLQTATGHMGKFSSSTVAFGNIMSTYLTKVLDEAVKLLKESVTQYAQQELAMTRLAFTVGGKATPALIDFAKAQSDASIYSDNTIIALESQLAKYGLLPDQIKAATQAAINYASITGVSLPEAGTIFGQAMAGMSRELGKQGLKLLETDTRAERFSKTLKFLNEKYSEGAGIIKNTLYGQMESLKNSFDEFLESVGRLVSSMGLPKVIEGFTSIADKMKDIVNSIKQMTWANFVKILTDAVASNGPLPNMNKFLAVMIEGFAKLGKDAPKALDKITAGLKGNIPPMKEEIVLLEKIRSGYREAEREAKIREENMTEIMASETRKRIQTARGSFEANATFSQALTTKIAEDTKSWGTVFANTVINIRDKFASGLSDILVNGGNFRDAMKQLGNDILQYFIEEVIKKIVSMWIASLGGLGTSTSNAMTASARGLGANALSFYSVNNPRNFMPKPGEPIGEFPIFTPPNTGNPWNPPGYPPENPPGKGPITSPIEEIIEWIGRILSVKSSGVNVYVSGQFIEGDPSKWQRLIREKIAPEVRRFAMSSPDSPFIRKRGSL